jgi:D-glycero-D-manno-heptose 1,7-bisphosphate phosphatase
MPEGGRLRTAVFLDRDGTLNRTEVRDGAPRPPNDVEELEILPGVREALERLKRAGLLLVVVTNQPDVARGSLDRRSVEQLHTLLRRRLPLDAIYCCFHDDLDDCPCRKPRPGLLVEAAARFGIELSGSFMVGDRWRDVEAGQRAGCTTVLLRQPYSGATRAPADFEAADLAEAAEIISHCRDERPEAVT